MKRPAGEKLATAVQLLQQCLAQLREHNAEYKHRTPPELLKDVEKFIRDNAGVA
jgi:hypothetical protein